MLDNDPLIKYGPHIILLCIMIYYGLSKYLETYVFKDDNNE